MSESSQAITAEDVQRLAHLARLTVGEAEVTLLGRQMNAILRHMDAIKSIDLQRAESLSQASPPATPLRPDKVQPSYPIDRVLQNAPERIGDGFGVPKIIE